MKDFKYKIIAISVIILRTFLLFWDFNTRTFDFSVYIVNFYKIGNDYYLASIASALYVLSSVILLISLCWKKQSNKLIMSSILCILIASVIEIIVYFLFQKDNMFVPNLFVSACSSFLGALCVFIGFVAVKFLGKSITLIKYACIVAIVLCLIHFIWEIFTRQNLNLSVTLSFVLNYILYPLLMGKDQSRDASTIES